MEGKIFGCVFVAISLFSLVQGGHISVTPVDVVATVGTDVTFSCKWEKDAPDENDAVEWLNKLTVQDGGDRIFLSATSENKDPNKYVIQGEFDLMIKDVQLTDAGRYGCRLLVVGTLHTADLVVVEPITQTIPTLHNAQHASLLCNINFGSPQVTETAPELLPSLRAFIGGQEVMGEVENAPGMPGVSASKYRLIVNYTASKMDNGEDFLCVATTEVPFKEYMQYTPLSVHYPVENLKLHPIHDKYRGGQKINCSAEGNPEPSYRWHPVSSPAPMAVTGSILTLTNAMAGDNTWKCISTNSAINIEFVEQEISFTVEEGSEGSVGSGTQTTWSVVQVLVPLTSYLAMRYM